MGQPRDDGAKTATRPKSKSKGKRLLADFLESVTVLEQEIQQLYLIDEVPWIIGYSGGKDSTATLQLVWHAIAALPEEQRTKPIHVISTDTLVENPVISTWVRASLERIGNAAQEQGLPFVPHQLSPEVENTFWVNLIGKGYPAPRNKFRWCTERLKIQPSNRFVREVVRDSGETILVLGTRTAESSRRAATMAKHAENRMRDRLSPNASLPNSLIYSPIEDWRTDEVWIFLNQFPNPWGHSNKELFVIYRGATADNECPLVVDTSTPSCGSSRFGCWVCTMVEQDKSMEAMIFNDEAKEWMQPLLDFRDELDFRAEGKRELEQEHRDFRRITGRVQLFERNLRDTGEKEITNIPGPYTKAWREYLLTQLLKTQVEVRAKAPGEMHAIELISASELSEIRRIWLEEKHEFDDTVPRIYESVMGESFQDPRSGARNRHLGSDEWSLLEELCDDPMELELITRLLDTERQYQTMARRVGVIDSLEKCFDTSSRNKEQALEAAHKKRALKEASKALKEHQEKAPEGKEDYFDYEPPKPASSWADLKYGAKQTDPA